MNRMIRRGRAEDGAAAVEFALIAGVLALLIFGMLEFGLAFWQVRNLRAATREAARTAAVRAPSDTIRDRLVSASNGSLPPGYSGFTVAVTPGPGSVCTNATSGDEVKVAIVNNQLPSGVQGAFQLDIPFMPSRTIDPDLSGTFRCE